MVRAEQSSAAPHAIFLTDFSSRAAPPRLARSGSVVLGRLDCELHDVIASAFFRSV